jgi:hypothetical protein
MRSKKYGFVGISHVETNGVSTLISSECCGTVQQGLDLVPNLLRLLSFYDAIIIAYAAQKTANLNA